MNQKYLSLDECLGVVKERAEVSDVTKETAILDMLQDSGGFTPGGLTVYRPYLVAARFLEQDHTTQKLSEAGDVVFTGLAVVIASLYSQQAGIDQAYGLIVPPAFQPPQGAITARRLAAFPGGSSSSKLRVVF